MLVPVRWLREFVSTELTTEQIAQRLTMAGLEAENITRIGAGWDSVYVGLVEKVERHPDADRLVLATVAAGEHHLTVVTGAPNIAENQKVALALAGARLIDGHSDEIKYITLKPSSIRGVRSEGMVCSERELGLSEEHEGIMVLDDDAPVGATLREYLGDDVIEFEITPNLVHAFSVLGIARELAAIINAPQPNVELAELATVPRDDALVTIEDEALCPRYALAIIENVTIGPSPSWLQRRLEAAGMRPVNNVVDASNYVMVEIGQPTHPFDADTLSEGRVVVRGARSGETLESIDHVQRELSPDMLVIADAERAVAIAGVMGGVNTEVSDRTTRVLLESAAFNSRSIRRTSRELKLRSDASGRFERGVDPALAWTAIERITQILSQIDPGARVTTVADAYPSPVQRTSLSMNFSEIERLLGMEIPLDDAVAILSRLSFEPVVAHPDDGIVITVSVPTYRSDVHLAADLVEEVARIYGYDSLPESLPAGTTVPVRRDPERIVDRIAQDALVQAGLQQVQTYTMISDSDLAALSADGNTIPDVLGGYTRPEGDYVRAANPLREDWEIMRPTMIPSLLKIVSENLKFSEQVAIFETARTYQPRGRNELPDERRAVSVAMSGPREAFTLYRQDTAEYDFFDVKGVLELLLNRLGGGDAAFSRVVHPSLHPGRAAAIAYRGEHIGVIGEVHPTVAQHFGIDARVAVAEIDLRVFAETLNEPWTASNVSRYQPTRQDFAIVVDDKIAAGDVEVALRSGAGPLASAVELFDVYRGSGVDDGKKSLAFRVTLAAPDRQLAEHEIDRIRKKIEQNVKKRVGGTLRS